MIMARLGGQGFLKGAAILCLVLLPLTLVMAEAVSCHADNDDCTLAVCCLPCLLSAGTLPHPVQASSNFLPEINTIKEIFAPTLFHPPRI